MYHKYHAELAWEGVYRFRRIQILGNINEGRNILLIAAQSAIKTTRPLNIKNIKLFSQRARSNKVLYVGIGQANRQQQTNKRDDIIILDNENVYNKYLQVKTDGDTISMSLKYCWNIVEILLI